MVPLRLLATGVLTACFAVSAQPPSSDFNAFRQQLLGDYKGFRKGILDDYSQFLDGVWDEYKAFKARERDHTPKPEMPPVAEPEAKRIPWKMKTPVRVMPEPVLPDTKPSLPARPKPSVPVPGPSVDVDSKPSRPDAERSVKIDFYGMEVELPEVEVTMPSDMGMTSGFADAWRILERSEVRKGYCRH